MVKTVHVCDICKFETSTQINTKGPSLIMTKFSNNFGSGYGLTNYNQYSTNCIQNLPPYELDLCPDCYDKIKNMLEDFKKNKEK